MKEEGVCTALSRSQFKAIIVYINNNMSVNKRSVEVTREEAQNREEDRLPYVCVDNEVLHARDKQVGNFTIRCRMQSAS